MLVPAGSSQHRARSRRAHPSVDRRRRTAASVFRPMPIAGISKTGYGPATPRRL